MSTEHAGAGRGPERVAVVGCGSVGATSAYALMLAGHAREVVLLEQGMRRAVGEAMDLQHAAALARPRPCAARPQTYARSCDSRER